MKPHVLIVDASLPVRLELRAAFAAEHFAAATAESVAAARRALGEQVYGAVTLDLDLPDGDGADLVREIRAAPAFAATVIVALTAASDASERVRSLARGLDDVVAKPADARQVVRRVAGLLGSADGGRRPAAAATPKRILVVDASRTYADAVTAQLHVDGFDVVTAASSTDALDLIGAPPVDAVLLDGVAAATGGVALCRRIRATAGLRLIPILMLVARESARVEALAAGADEAVTKSYEFATLRARVRELVTRGSDPRRSRGSTRRLFAVNAGADLVHRVAEASGLSSVLGPSVVERVFSRVGVDAAGATYDDLELALPALRSALSLFVSPDELEERMRAISALLARTR